MKKILTISVLALLAGYIVFAAVALCRKPAEQRCEGVQLEIRDSLKTGYMTTRDITALLSANKLDPTGKLLDEVSLRAIEKALETSPLVASCECYKTINGYVMVEVECRRPILRVIADGNDSFYIDEEGEVIERIPCGVYVPIATGYVTRKFAKKELYALAQFFQEEELWNAQIEQIHVTARQEIELIPRVGDHIIELGRPGDYAEKFGKLKAFYEKGLNEVGWDRYSRISIDYDNQVVATRRKR